MGYPTSEDEAAKKLRLAAAGKKPASNEEEKSIDKRMGLIESIMNENRQAQKKRSEQEGMPSSIHDMLESLMDELPPQ